jgi:hypothetical protein
MLVFLKRLRLKILEEKRIGKYLLYAIGEVCLVVIGILIALQINNWNTARIQKEDAKNSYLNIKRQVLDDQRELLTVKDFNNNLSRAYEYALRISIVRDKNRIDSLALVTMGLSQYSDFHTSGDIYATLVNSGDLKILKNEEITAMIQKLESTYIYINKLEEMHWELIMTEVSDELRGVINYTTQEIKIPEKLYALEMQNIFYEIIGLTKMKNSVYTKALEEIDLLITKIDKELLVTKY